MGNDNFPRLLEKDVEKFMKEYSLDTNKINESNMESEEGSVMSANHCFRVKEEDSENEEEKEEDEEQEEGADEHQESEDEVHNLSSDNLKRLEEVELHNNPRAGSIVIDEDGEKFMDTKAEESLGEINQSNLEAYEDAAE